LVDVVICFFYFMLEVGRLFVVVRMVLRIERHAQLDAVGAQKRLVLVHVPIAVVVASGLVVLVVGKFSCPGSVLVLCDEGARRGCVEHGARQGKPLS